MKILIPVLALVFAALNAQAQMRPREITHFTCGAMGNPDVVSLQVGGARYGDAINIDLTDDETLQFLQPNEAATLKTWQQKFGGSLQFGSCKRGTGNDLVTCRLDRMTGMQGWAIIGLSFYTEQEFAPGVTQGALVSRHMGSNDIVISVTKQGDQAHLKMTATIDDGVNHAKVVSLDKNVGTLKQDWYMCKFE